MSLKTKRLLFALFFFILTILSAVSMVQKGFTPNYILYTLIFTVATVFLIRHAIKS